MFLFGEHAVVYGKPGIAMAIKPRVFVTVRETKRPQRAKSSYIDGCFEAMGVSGSVYINSQIPSSSGLGSSAAVTVATLSAINEEFGKNKTREEIANMAFEIEKTVHVIRRINAAVETIASTIEAQSVVTHTIAENITQASAGLREASQRVGAMATVRFVINFSIFEGSIASDASTSQKIGTPLAVTTAAAVA